MLSKDRRIERKEFSLILSTGLRFNSSGFLLYVAKMPINMANVGSKIAFSVSKKVCQKAVDRNKYRRRGYQAVLPVLKSIKPGYYLFFVYKKGLIPTRLKTIETEVAKLLSESHVLE